MQLSDRPIATPVHIRWQRAQHQLIPFLAVLLCAGAAWRLWREAPRITAVGQVDLETVEIRSPASGEEVTGESADSTPLRLLDTVARDQVLVEIQTSDGKKIEVKAPFEGQIVKMHTRAGESLTKGQSLFTVAGDRGLSITTYIRSDQRAEPVPGMAVEVRQRSDASKSYRATIERVGPQYESVPAAQLRDRKTEEWGLPVIINVPAEANFKPGELVYIGWLPGAASKGS